MRNVKRLVACTLTILGLTLLGCTREKDAPLTPTPSSASTKDFVLPTAEEAYRLQDDCTHRGEKILRDNVIGVALSQEQVSRYNPTTNRCYVRLQVHARFLSEWGKYDNSTYLEDGQTGEMLAFFRLKPNGERASLGFGCSDSPCVEEKVADCMSGKACAP
jgi:hypothetical protein